MLLCEDYMKYSCVTKNDEFCQDFHQCIENDGGRKDVFTFLIHMCERAYELENR